MDASLILTIAAYAVPVLFAITLHEAAHAFAARQLGDDTAWMLGRVSLNPLRHIDPLGTIAMPLLLYVITNGAFVFGYAKPVPVMFRKLRDPRWGSLGVAAAGPLCNLAQAILWALLGVALVTLDMAQPFLMRMFMAGIIVNIVMGVLNLFPLPPLDGGRVLVALLPRRISDTFSRIEPYGFLIVLALVWSGIMTKFWLAPLCNLCYRLILLPFSSI